MKKIFFLLSFALLIVGSSFGQNLVKSDIDKMKVFECASIDVDGDGVHDHYEFVVQDTILNQFYYITDNTSESGVTSAQIKTYLSAELLKVVKKEAAKPLPVATRDTVVIGKKISDL